MHFTVDHIVPEVFGGGSDLQNLCLACWDCNLAKGGRVAATDALTNQLTPLYHPRKQAWQKHFGWEDEGLYIVGRTASGRATVEALTLNREVLVQARQFWTEVGWHPPDM